METNILNLAGIVLIGMVCVAMTVQTIEGTPNRIGKIIAGIFCVGLIFFLYIFVLDSPIFQYWGIHETLASFSGLVALVVGGFCGYFLSTSHK